ncbi:MAG: cation transporter [Acidobacteriota bacterium]|nr:cation transporter [Acidobacteriota bacterium]
MGGERVGGGEWTRAWSLTSRLWLVLGLNAALVVGLLVVGVAAGSLAVWAEGVDYLADAAAIGVALGALQWERRRSGSGRATRAAARLNAGWLLVLSVAVAVGSAVRLASGTRHVNGLPVLIVSAVAALVMSGGAVVLGGDVDGADDDAGDGAEAGRGGGDRARGVRGGGDGAEAGRGDVDGGSLSVRAVLLDTVADAAAAAGVAASGLVIWLAGGWYWLDPAAALVISAVVAFHAARLLGHIRAAARR